MSKHLIEMEIPDGNYCIDRLNKLWCDHIHDATSGDGMLCSLIFPHDENCLIFWDNHDEFNKALKCKKCPSLKEV